MKELDVRRLACPGPVLELKNLLQLGETNIRLRVGDELARSNVTRFAAAQGARVSSDPAEDGSFVVTIETQGPLAVIQDEEVHCEPLSSSSGRRVVQISAEHMGTGDETLGALLMRSFLKTQIELDEKPDALVFYNAGVKLCCQGSPLVDDLRALEEEGIEIIACGTCLNYFELSDKLEVGRVTDMLEIASLLASAGATVRP